MATANTSSMAAAAASAPENSVKANLSRPVLTVSVSSPVAEPEVINLTRSNLEQIDLNKSYLPSPNGGGYCGGNGSGKKHFSVDKFFKMMKYERLRLITYLLHRHQWPLSEVISPTELAKAGLFYIRDDEVQCAFCRGVISGWSYGDIAMEEHASHFPKCPFVRGQAVGNVSVENDPDVTSSDCGGNGNGSYSSDHLSCDAIGQQALADKLPYNIESQAMFPLFASAETRMATYGNPMWNSDLDRRLLVESGFFFTGKKDRTRCFQCGGLLFKWAHNDDPFEEHAKYFPKCKFILDTKGEDYLEYIRFKSQIIELRLKAEGSPATKEKDLECMRNISFENFLQMKQSASRVSRKLVEQSQQRQMRNENGNSSDSGVSESASFYQRYLQKFSFLIDCQKLFQYLLGMDVIKPTSSFTSSTSSNWSSSSGSSSSGSASPDLLSSTSGSLSSADSSPRSSISNLVFSLSDGSGPEEFEIPPVSTNHGRSNNTMMVAESVSSAESSSVAKSKTESEEERQTELRTKLTCAICYENEICVVFLPCGHQLACISCSKKIETCPICRTVITKRLRTYFP